MVQTQTELESGAFLAVTATFMAYVLGGDEDGAREVFADVPAEEMAISVARLFVAHLKVSGDDPKAYLDGLVESLGY